LRDFLLAGEFKKELKCVSDLNTHLHSDQNDIGVTIGAAKQYSNPNFMNDSFRIAEYRFKR
jgi:hypothetical protein